ncbi:MAG: M15 family metallopeptidase [Terricaulis sp.]
MRPAPHATGGAVDLTIVWDDGAPLWMGSLFDDATSLAGTDRFERDTDDFSFSHEEARANRRLLYWLMIEAGFSNHPDEWVALFLRRPDVGDSHGQARGAVWAG